MVKWDTLCPLRHVAFSLVTGRNQSTKRTHAAVEVECSQPSIFSYFYLIADRAGRIARKLYASAKQDTWRAVNSLLSKLSCLLVAALNKVKSVVFLERPQITSQPVTMSGEGACFLRGRFLKVYFVSSSSWWNCLTKLFTVLFAVSNSNSLLKNSFTFYIHSSWLCFISNCSGTGI